MKVLNYMLVIRETAIIYDKDLDPIAHKANVARLIGRQVAHQCFGFFNPSWFYHWIHNGIAMLFAADAINQVVSSMSICPHDLKNDLFYYIYIQGDSE